MQLEGLTALITGSTDGIGRETALAFAAEGADVMVSGRNARRGSEVVDEVAALGRAALFVSVDLSDTDSVRRLAGEALDVDVLVNNAAVFHAGATPDTGIAAFDESLAVNVRAPFLLTAAIAPAMASRGSGVIVNVTSMAANSASPTMAVYAATKAALNSLTRSWAAEFASGGVRVNAVSVGPTLTPAAEAAGPEVRAGFAATTLLGRHASMREIAEAVVFLSSSRASYITGAILDVDGGNSAM